MIRITGLHNTAIVYTDNLEESARAQIQAVCDRPEFADSNIRIMPDVHAGMGCTIGTTMTITDKIVPGMVGVDIGCGMETIKLAEKKLDYQTLDDLIRRSIPSGRDVRKEAHPYNDKIELSKLICAGKVKLDRARKSIGTLGGGNHFIEVDRNDDGDLYLIVHSGSRHLGNEVAQLYQEEAFRSLCGNSKQQIESLIEEYKSSGKDHEIEEAIKELRSRRTLNFSLPKDLTYLSGQLFVDYLHDMSIIQLFAVLNRQAIADTIVKGLRLTETERFTTIHNYVDLENNILRKGAVSAKLGEKLLIPINMKDGALICRGKGNADWNYSAPHGAGRLFSRKEAFRSLSLEKFQQEMQGIFTTSVNRKTLDEAPMAYKHIDEIIKHIQPTSDIIERIRPVYNFKAQE